eukprot:161704-Chlamydomonas_euryale.AAC.9
MQRNACTHTPIPSAHPIAARQLVHAPGHRGRAALLHVGEIAVASAAAFPAAQRRRQSLCCVRAGSAARTHPVTHDLPRVQNLSLQLLRREKDAPPASSPPHTPTRCLPRALRNGSARSQASVLRFRRGCLGRPEAALRPQWVAGPVAACRDALGLGQEFAWQPAVAAAAAACGKKPHEAA